MTGRLRLSREEYTVGWVCALPLELAAAKGILDEEHDSHQDDSMIYTLGRLGEHNLVIVCLPGGDTGTNAASVVAAQIAHSFPSIRFGMVIGIAGGVPTALTDIRLGDVVVSLPKNDHSGVVQYDLGKATPNGFERTGYLNAPPRILRNVVSQMQADNINGKAQSLIELAKLKGLPAFSCERTGSDLLFRADYDHVGGATCEECDKMKIIERRPRETTEPLVHYGTIASGNQLMRNAAERDQISSDLGGVLCFEMEAAGLMNILPCLVIRGICDYADSHKNKNFQAYAAGISALYAKQLLSAIHQNEVIGLREITGVIKEIEGLTLKEFERLLEKAKAQTEKSNLKIQESSNVFRQNDRIILEAKSNFLGFLYRLLWAFGAPSTLLALLNMFLDENTTTMQGVITSTQCIATDLGQEGADLREIMEKLDGVEERVKQLVQVSERENESTDGRPGKSKASAPPKEVDPYEFPSKSAAEHDKTTGKAERDARLEETDIIRIQEENIRLRDTLKVVEEERARMESRVSSLEENLAEAGRIRAESEDRGLINTVWAWIKWVLSCGLSE